MYKVDLSLTSKNFNQVKEKRNPFFKGFSHAGFAPVNKGMLAGPQHGDIFVSSKSTVEKPEVINNFVDGVNNFMSSTGSLISSYAGSVLNGFAPGKRNNDQLKADLMKDLDSSNEDETMTAIALLGKLQAEEAVDKFAKILEKKSTNIEVAAEVISALTHINNSKVVQPIIDILIDTNRDEGLRALAAISMGKMKNRRASKPLFEILRNQDDSPVVRSYAALALSEFQTIRNTEQLVRALEDSSALVRANAVLALGILGYKDAIPQVVKLLRDSDPNVKSNAILTLGNLKAESALEDLIYALEDTNTDIVVSVARAFKHIGTSEATKKLVEAIDNRNNPIILRRNASACLQHIKDTKSISTLNKVLGDKDEDLMLRNYALTALINMRASESLINLKAILADDVENFQLKINAAAGIGLLGDEHCIPLLLKTAQETEITALKLNCINGIRAITSRTVNKSVVDIDKLLPLLKDESEKAKAMIADTLGMLKSKKAVKPLIEMATNSKEHILARSYAIQALGAIGDKNATDDLLNILKTDKNHIICSRAAASLYNLGMKKVLFDIIETKSDNYEVQKHSAGVLISMGEKSKALENFLKPGLQVKKLHDNDIKGQGIAAAVIDDVVDPAHPEFDDRVVLEPLEHHGTMVSGSLGGNISGVAPKVKIHSYNAFGTKEIDQILEKVVEQKLNGDNDIKVVNISLGFNAKMLSDPNIQAIVERFDKAAKMANKLGITVVVASGNDGRDMPIPGLGTLNLLCLSENIISVGATNSNGTPDDPSDDTRAEFSSYPDENFRRQLDVMAPGFEVTLPYTGGSYKTVDGTSFAAPFVAGLVALMYQVNPDISPAKVKAILKETATKLQSVPENMQGSGEVNPIVAVVEALRLVNPKKAGDLGAKLGLQQQMTIFDFTGEVNKFTQVA